MTGGGSNTGGLRASAAPVIHRRAASAATAAAPEACAHANSWISSLATPYFHSSGGERGAPCPEGIGGEGAARASVPPPRPLLFFRHNPSEPDQRACESHNTRSMPIGWRQGSSSVLFASRPDRPVSLLHAARRGKAQVCRRDRPINDVGPLKHSLRAKAGEGRGPRGMGTMSETQVLLSRIVALRQRLEQAQGLAREAGAAAVGLLGDGETVGPARLRNLEASVAEGGECPGNSRRPSVRPRLPKVRRPCPPSLPRRARRSLERGRGLLSALRGLASEPAVQEGGSIAAVLCRECTVMTDAALHLVRGLPDSPSTSCTTVRALRECWRLRPGNSPA